MGNIDRENPWLKCNQGQEQDEFLNREGMIPNNIEEISNIPRPHAPTILYVMRNIQGN